jgi:Uma2 family endonuclease
VLSPRPRIGDLDRKVHWYAEYGVREIWLINQANRGMQVLQCESGQVARRHDIDGTITSAVLPGFQTSLIDLLGW